MPEEHGKTLISWKFSEYKNHKRGFLWYVLAFIIIAGLLLYSVFSVNFLFGVIVILMVIIYFFYFTRQPRKIDLKITEDGIELDGKFYSYKELKKFWVIYDPPKVKNLYLDFKSISKPLISIPLEDQNPVEVRKALLDYLEEDIEKEEESASDGLSRILKL